MKKILFLLAYLLTCTIGQAQTYSSGHLTAVAADTMVHDSTFCRTYVTVYNYITVDSSYIGNTVYVIDTSTGILENVYVDTVGVSPWFVTNMSLYSVSDLNLASGFVFTFLPRHIKKITCGWDTVISTGAPDTLFVPDPCEYSDVTGSVFADNNGNCVYDAGDSALSIPLHELFTYSMFTPPGSGYSGALGYGPSGMPAGFIVRVQKSWVSSFSIDLPAYYYFVYDVGTCGIGPHVFTSFPASGADFPLKCTSSVDVQSTVMCPPRIRAHRSFFLRPRVSNTGCDPASGQMKLILDSRTVYNPALSLLPADSVFGDTLVWNYTGLTNLTGTGYWNSILSAVHLTPDTTVWAGDTLCFTVLSDVPATDIDPTNNTYTLCLPVVYSYDPNIKAVVPQGEGADGNIPVETDTLEYTVHFQNTGTAPAYTVVITDTLDGNINPASLKILGSSHRMSPKWLAPDVVQFVFNSIYLPDSLTNEPASHGSVKFSVALTDGLPVGAQIRNKAYIYFDLNPPVITNTVLNTLSEPSIDDTLVVGANSLDMSTAISIYPNPAHAAFTVRWSDATAQHATIELADITGRVVLTQDIGMGNKPGSVNIRLGDMTPGLYIVQLRAAGMSYNRKLIIR